MACQGPVYDLTTARGRAQTVVDADLLQDRHPLLHRVHSLDIRFDVLGIQYDSAHLQCAIEGPE